MKEFSQEYIDYLKSDHWKELREKAIKRSALSCELSSYPLSRRICHVHHLVYRNLTDVLEGDLMVVSSFLHRVIHIWKDNGELVAKGSKSRKKELKKRFKDWLDEGMPGSGPFKKCRKWINLHKNKRQIRPEKRRKAPKKPRSVRTVSNQPSANRTGFTAPRKVFSEMTEAERHAAAIERNSAIAAAGKQPVYWTYSQWKKKKNIARAERQKFFSRKNKKQRKREAKLKAERLASQNPF